MTERIAIDEVNVGERHRKDLGDLTSLMKSMDRIGLLHPIVLDDKNNLIVGQRRLEAARMLNWSDIPYRIARNLDTAVKLMQAESDENECRKGFSPSEAVAIGKSLEALERPKAAARQATSTGGKDPKPACAQRPQAEGTGRTRDIVGPAVGMSGASYGRAKAVVDAAEDDPETFGPIRDEMDRTGKVKTAFDKVQTIKAEAETPEPAAQPPRRRQGVGLRRGNEAIECLMHIPKDDPFRERGFQVVEDWIKHHK